VRVDDELVLEALGIGEAQAAARLARARNALAVQAGGPELDGGFVCDAPRDAVRHPAAVAARRGARELEERQHRARRRELVAVVQVVDVGLIEVDGLLDHPQAEDARVEVDVARRVGRDRGDVMESLESHAARTVCRRGAERQQVGRAPRSAARPGERAAGVPFRGAKGTLGIGTVGSRLERLDG